MKKKILTLLFILTLSFCSVGDVMASVYNVYSIGTGSPVPLYEIEKEKICLYGGFSGALARSNAVRISVVDKDGNRVRGTISADFTNKNTVLPLGTNKRYQSKEKKMRNEIVASGTSYDFTTDAPSYYEWRNLPEFSSLGGGALKNYFITKFATADRADMMWIFRILNYDGYNNEALRENHYLKVEPIFHLFVTTPYNIITVPGMMTYESGMKIQDMLSSGYCNSFGGVNSRCEAAATAECYDRGNCKNVNAKDCDLNKTYIYGTVTEIYSILKSLNHEIFNYDSAGTIMLALGKIVYDDGSIGTLTTDATPVMTKTGILPHLLSNYGIGSMHVWMNTIMNGDSCTDANGVVWDIPEGLTPEQIEQFKQEYCPQPEGGTCPPDSQFPQKIIPPDKTDENEKQQWIQENCYTGCQYKIESNLGGDCYENGDTDKAANRGYVKDAGDINNEHDWKCIFDTIDAPANTYQGEFYNPLGYNAFKGNHYCKVACREEVNYDFPTTFEAVAGRYFSIGTSGAYVVATLGPNIITGKTTCATAYFSSADKRPYIDHAGFARDYFDKNVEIINKWNDYQKANAALEAIKNGTAVAVGQPTKYDEACNHPMKDNENDCPSGFVNGGIYSVFTHGPTSAEACRNCDPAGYAQDGYGICCYEVEKSCPGGYAQIPDVDNCDKWDHGGSTRSTYEIQKYSNTWDNEVYSATVDYDVNISEDSNEHIEGCDDLKPMWNLSNGKVYAEDGTNDDGTPKYKECRTKDSVKKGIENAIEYYEKLYNRAVTEREAMYAEIMQCNNFQRTYTEFDTNLSFAYAENPTQIQLKKTCQTKSNSYYTTANGTYESKNRGTVEFESSNQTFITNSEGIVGTKGTAQKAVCGPNLTACTTAPIEYPTNIGVMQTTETTCEFSLPDNLNKYTTKDGDSHTEFSEFESTPYVNSYATSPDNIGRLPISYATQSGKYPYKFTYYNGSLFGDNNKFNRYKDDIEEIKMGKDLTYTCYYNVKCSLLEITCPDGQTFDPNAPECCRPTTITQCTKQNTTCASDKVFDAGYPGCCRPKTTEDCIKDYHSCPPNSEFDPGYLPSCCRPKNDPDCSEHFVQCPEGHVYDSSYPGTCCRPETPKPECKEETTTCGVGEVFDKDAAGCCRPVDTGCAWRTCPDGTPMTVDCKCPPDKRGITIIYRPISLNDPFPGEDGEGRHAGDNWNGVANVLGTTRNFIDAYITNNRGVKTDEVYNLTPMYEFTLTPSNLRNIRKYNKTQKNNYNDIYTLECSNGVYCKSEFLKEGINNGYFGFTRENSSGGSCINAYSTNWESCRYTNIGG